MSFLQHRQPLQPIDNKPVGLYIHIPFCRSKCAYCDFYSFVPHDEGVMEQYVNALIKHMETYRDGMREYAPTTVFIGGGTPTALPPELLYRLIRALYKNFAIVEDAEFTVEANPATVSYELLCELRKLGVNRLSMGLQSANNNELKALGRIHKREDFFESYRMARMAGFDNINVDCMFGIPEQTAESLQKTLQYLVRLQPEHISLYDLILEEGTPLYKQRQKLIFPNEEAEANMYLHAVDFLADNGYGQYEISNFAVDGFYCQHNYNYWDCGEYLGLGVAAHSYLRGNRFSFVKDVNRYIMALSAGEPVNITDENETIDPWERVGEYIMLRLRLTDGIDEAEFARRFGKDFSALCGEKLKRYIQYGFATHRDGCYALTPKGFFVSNTILSDILDFHGGKISTGW